ncbi:MAG: hypothetical protein JST69_10005 [Bacteroidetes bacterium]|nr:hypothetical protein [Bacteroidota bacterium]
MEWKICPQRFYKMIYKTYLRNHAVIPGQENALKQFLNSDYKGMKHKLRNGHSSHSEDALTWSCFKVLDSFPQRIKFSALDEILEDTYEGKNKFKFTGSDYSDSDVKIFVGKTYT